MQKKLSKQLLIASNNPGKVKELRQLLAGLPEGQLVTPVELGIELSVSETGSTYLENASLKARAFAEASGLISLADDTGLEVDALDGAPGLYSARFSAKPGATDADRRAYLLEQLAGIERPWTARFRAVLVAAIPGAGETYSFEGICEGEIIPEERGENGFGYDPIFFINEKGMTMAQLSDQAKNEVSHRGRAAQTALPLLARLLTTGE